MPRNLARIYIAIQSDPLKIAISGLRESSPGGVLTVIYAETPSQEQLDRVHALIAKGKDSIAVKDGATELADNTEIVIPNNGVATRQLVVQYKNADGADGTGSHDQVRFVGRSLPIDKSVGALDSSGRLPFTIGPTSSRGDYTLIVECGPVPVRVMRIKFR